MISFIFYKSSIYHFFLQLLVFVCSSFHFHSLLILDLFKSTFLSFFLYFFLSSLLVHLFVSTSSLPLFSFLMSCFFYFFAFPFYSSLIHILLLVSQVPSSALMIYDRVEEFRRHVGILDLIVNSYNQAQVSYILNINFI